jgi:hypothetical protein
MASSKIDPEEVLYVMLNKRKVEIYELDTIESLKYRIALNSKDSQGRSRPLLPKLILLEEQVTEEVKESKIPVSRGDKRTNIVAGCKAVHIKNPELERINPLAQREFQVSDFPTLALHQITDAGMDVKKQRRYADEIIKVFSLDSIESYVKYVMYFAFGGLKKFDTVVNPVTRKGFMDAVTKTFGIGNFDIVLIHYDSWAEQIEKELAIVSARVKSDLALFQRYVDKLAGRETVTSSLQLDKTWLSVNFTIATDIYELFNGLILSSNVPFTGVGDFFKVLNTFKPPKQWAVRYPRDDLMIMYVLNRASEPERNKTKSDPKNYSPVFIIPGEVDEKTHTTSIEMEIQSRVDDELREDRLLSRIFEAFPFPVSGCTFQQKRVEADFLMPSPGSLDIPLFQDMILTDPLISQIMVIDESSRTFRQRGGVFAYFRYNRNVPQTDYMTCRINSKIVEAKDQARAPELFKSPGGKMIRVTLMKCKNIIEAERLRDIIASVMEYYYS